MALDAAEFISELSIVDPQGTDPLNQGDDQIRTTKRAVQQSFPLVNAAVSITAAQMNQMAIKNEANSFTLKNTFLNRVQIDGQLTEADGITTAPAYSFTSQDNIGMYRDVPDRLSFATANVLKFLIEPTRIQAQAPVFVGGGAGLTAGSPAFAFETAQNVGMFLNGADLSFAVAGVSRLTLGSAVNEHFQFVTFSAAGTRFFAFANHIRKTSTSGIAGIVYEDAAGVGRWLVGQSTANNGERWTMQRRNAAGTVQDSPFEVLNTDGHVRMLNVDMIRGVDTQNAVIAFMTAGTILRHTLNFEASGGFNPQSLTFSAFNSSGAFLGNTLRFGPNGELFMEFLPTTNPGGSNRLWKSGGFIAIT